MLPQVNTSTTVCHCKLYLIESDGWRAFPEASIIETTFAAQNMYAFWCAIDIEGAVQPGDYKLHVHVANKILVADVIKSTIQDLNRKYKVKFGTIDATMYYKASLSEPGEGTLYDSSRKPSLSGVFYFRVRLPPLTDGASVQPPSYTRSVTDTNAEEIIADKAGTVKVYLAIGRVDEAGNWEQTNSYSAASYKWSKHQKVSVVCARAKDKHMKRYYRDKVEPVSLHVMPRINDGSEPTVLDPTAPGAEWTKLREGHYYLFLFAWLNPRTSAEVSLPPQQAKAGPSILGKRKREDTEGRVVKKLTYKDNWCTPSTAETPRMQSGNSLLRAVHSYP
jgi:hypothetical protein